MQDDIIFRIITNLPYPFINRHDHIIYNTYPQLDPIKLFKNIIIASACGYLIGKFAKRRQILFGLLAPIPLVIKFVYDQWRTSASLRQFTDVDLITKELKIDRKEKKPQKGRDETVEIKNWQVIRNLPQLQQKYYNAQDFVRQLTPSYFNPKK